MNRKRVLAFSNSIFPLTFLVWAITLCLPEKAFGQCSTTSTLPAGNTSWTVPAGATSITVEVWGAGGKGGGTNLDGAYGGGGGGGYSRSTFTVTPLTTYAYSVGGGSINNSTPGGNSWFSLTNEGASFVRALGGNSAPVNSPNGAVGGAAGTGSAATFSGGNGANATTGNNSPSSNRVAGGGGSSAGTNSNGTNATNINGALAPSGGGNGGSGNIAGNGDGVIGSSPGGGGGGAERTSGNLIGGNGGNGRIIITYTIPANTVTSAAPNQTRCINVALNNITHTTTGATGIGVVTGLPPGVTAAWSGNIITISGTPTSAAGSPYNYSIPLTGGCITGALPATGTITVTPNNTAGPASSNPTLCINTALSSIAHTTTGATGIGFASGLPAGVTAAWASNTITISGTPSAPGTFNYSILLIGGCGSVSATGTIIVDAQAAINSPSLGTQTRCLNVAFIPISVGTAQGFTFQWYSNSTNVNSGGTLIPGATSNSFTPLSSIVGTTYYYVVVSSVTCGTTETSAASGAFIINALPVVSFDTQPAVGNYCVDTDIITYSTQPGQLNYVWTIPGLAGTDYTITSMSGVTLATSNSITLNYNTAGNKTITVNYQDANGCGSTAPVTSNTITVQKNTVTPDGNPSPTSVCVNAILPTTNTHTTSGATGIGTIIWTTSNPGGISATWSVNTISLSSNGNPVTAAPGIYVYSIPITGGCGALNATGSITVTPSNSAGAASSTPTLCINTALTNITHATTGASGIGTATGLPAGVTAAWAGNTITISGTPSASGTFNYSIPLTGGCNTPAVNATGTISVTPNNTVGAASSTPTLCINTALTNITHTTTGATGIGAVTGLPAGVTASWAGNTITISGTPTASGTFNYSMPLTGGCNTPAVNATGTIIVTPNNTVTSAAPNQTRCINVALANITHTTTGATGIGTATGLPSGVSASWAGNTITISGTPTASGTFNYSIPLTGGCNTPTVNATGTITVTPNNTVSVASSSPTICINIALTPITHTTTGSNGIGTATGLPAGVTASRAGNTITISGTPTASGTFNYSIPLTGGCGTVIATGTITVTPNNTIGAASSTPTLCINTALTNITHSTTGATGIGTVTGLPAGVTAVWNAGVITISGTPSASGTFSYSIPLTGGCNTPAVNASGTISVTPNNTVTSAAPNQTGCINVALANITHNTTGATGIGTATGLPTGITASWNAAVITISGTPTVSGTFNYSIPLIGGCNTPAVNATGTITVTANNSVSAASSSPTLCINTGLTAITFTTTGATGIGTATGLPAGVAASWNAGVITISGTPSASGTFSYSIPLTGGCNTPSMNASGTITVNPATTIVSESLAAQSICNGQNFSSISINATGTGTLVYQWYTNTVNNNTTGTSIGGANSSSYTPPSSPIGTKYYYVTVSSNCGPLRTSSISGAFTIDPITSITTQPDTSNQVECFGDGFNPISVSAIGGGLSYQWYRNPTSSNLNGISVPGANSPTFTPPSNSQGIAYYYVIVTGNCGTQTSTISGEFLVNPPVTTISNPSTSPQTVCIGAPFSGISVIATGEGTVTYQWYSNSNNSNSGGTLVSGAISPSFTPLATAVGTTYYYAVASSNCGTVPSAISGAFTVTPLTTINTESLTSQNICFGNTFTPISVNATGTGTLNYQWYTNTANNNSAGTLIIGATSSSYTPPSSSAGTNYYYVMVSSACGPNKVSNPSGAFTVTPTNIAGAPSSTPTLCINSPLANITHSTTGATGIGSVTGLPAGVSASLAGNTITISGTPTASGTFNYIIPLTGGCGIVNATGTITVNPIATVAPTSVAFPSVCISSPALTPFTQTTTGVTAIGIPSGLPPGITTSFNSITGVITFSGTATTTGLFSYSIPLIGNCINGLNATGTIDVTPVYDITSVSSVSATTIGGAATVTFFGNPLTMLNGTYQIVYQIKQASGAFTTVGPVNATVVNGKGTFSTTSINSTVDTYTVQILTIKKSTDVCTVTLPIPPTTYFGVCSAVFSANSTFYVPANVYSITIEVYGGGGGGGSGGGGGGGYTIRKNIPVTPGEPLGVIFLAGGGAGADGGATYVTRDSNIANQLGNSLVLANGGKGGSSANAQGGTFDPRFSGSNGSNASTSNGGKGGGPLGGNGGTSGVIGSPPGGGGGGGNRVGGRGLLIISYSCPDADNTDCIKVIDDGSKSGTTVIEFTCNDTWTAPEGLVEFTTYVASGGGGGGRGFGSGGGGSGALIQQIFSSSNPNGLPAGTSFAITVGDGGNGATPETGATGSGMDGSYSSFSGSINGSSINITVPGGGGGGSQSSIPGANGASGGGGGARPNPGAAGGQGGNSIPITYSGTGVTLYQGNFGGNGEYSGSQNSIAGGGGGGLIAWVSSDRPNGKAAGNGQGEGGDGGKGVTLTMGDTLRYFGAGGGGIGEYFNGTEKVGIGGSSASGLKLGGDGNLANPTAIGGAGRNKTGSGGGAGYGAGGKGGKGIVYITFVNFRILTVEYEYFTATYSPENRSGELIWATAKEWENSHFEIERSVNEVTSWTKIGEIDGQGYSETPTEYSFTDTKLPASGGIVYYRLKQVDFDGTFAYSVTRAIQVNPIDGSTSWLVYPNPTTGYPFEIGLLASGVYREEPITVRIISATGTYDVIESTAINSISKQVSDWLQSHPSGVYTLEIIWGIRREYHKVILRK